nr:hypothetical protein [Tanacetum cinerariifolium]
MMINRKIYDEETVSLQATSEKESSPADQYIFQRRVSEPTGSSGYNESPYALLGQSNSEEESEKVMLGAEEGGQDEGQAGPDPDAQAKDQTRSDAGQVGSNPDETSEGQAGPDPGDAEAKERLDSHGSRLYTLEQLDIPQQVSIAVSEMITDAVDWAMQAPLRNRFRDIPEADMKETL